MPMCSSPPILFTHSYVDHNFNCGDKGDAKQRAAILKQNPEAKEIIHPCIAGDDIRRYELHYRNRFLIYTYHGVDIRRFPAVKTHLESFRSYRDSDGKLIGLEHRATQQEWYELQQPQRSCEANYRAPKIVLPDIGKELRFSMDDGGHFIENTAFAIAAADYYLLGVLNARIVWDFLKEACAALGDRDEGGRLRFLRQYIEMLPVPTASAAERKAVGELASKVQELHVQRRKRVERFLRDLGLDPAQSTSRNPMEQPWNLSATEFAKRAKRQPVKFHESARDETAALTEQIAKLETEINARVATLYGL